MNILAITTMRNEGPHLLEWIAHHLVAGIGHFLIYSNDCNDGTDALLDLLAGVGIVSHERLTPRDKPTLQWQALKHAATHKRYADADWVLVADCDEFINLRAPLNTLQDLIAALPENTDALAMPWRLFGHSGQIEMQDQLTTRQFIRAAPKDISLPLAHFFKSMFRPATFRQIGVHRPKRHKDKTPVWVDGSGTILPDGFVKQDSRINLFGLPVGDDLVQLNHYSLRSAENFMVKRSRGLPNHMTREIGLGYWVERNFNTHEDSSIQRMELATLRKLDELRSVPGVEALHQSAFAAHRQKFSDLMKKRDEIQLFWQISLSAGSEPPTRALAQTQIRRIIEARKSDG